MPVQHYPECLVRVMAGGLVDQLAEPVVYQCSIIIRSSSAPRACPHLRPPDSLTSPVVLDAGRDWVLLGERGELDVPVVAVYRLVEGGG